MQMSRAMLTHEHRMPVKEAGASLRMKELSAQYLRYGYRRIRIFLGRDGFEMSVSKAWRLCKRQRAAVAPQETKQAGLLWEGRNRWRQREPIRCGHTTLSSMPAPIGSNSSV